MQSREIHIHQISPDELKTLIKEAVDEKISTTPVSKEKSDELMTVDETIKFLKCSKQALWNWRKNGILNNYRLGNRVYYRKSDIFDKLIKQE